MAANWTAHANCPAHIRGEVEARVSAFPPSFLEEPTDSKAFISVFYCGGRQRSSFTRFLQLYF